MGESASARVLSSFGDVAMARKLGKVQEHVLKKLQSHGQWSLHCGWVWSSESFTKKIMDRLVELGYAVKVVGVYFPERASDHGKDRRTS